VNSRRCAPSRSASAGWACWWSTATPISTRPAGPAWARTHILVIGVTKSAFRTATHAVLVLRGTSARPLFVTAGEMARTEAADLVRHMASRYRLADALRRADMLARTGLPATTLSCHCG
jgi:hypothetical protein